MNPTFSPNETRRWMLVDDNAHILAMMALMIQNLTGAEIETHRSPVTALAAFAAAPASYELVITDFEMPDMDGVELCRRMRMMNPAQKLFLATGSGYFTEAGAWHAGFSALLNKPFPLATLQAALAKAGLEAVCVA